MATQLMLNVSRIKFLHIPTGEVAELPCYLTQFEDSLDTTWGAESVYGRIDPIQTYQGTKRSISLSFTVPALTIHESKYFLSQLDKLMQFQYPVYTDSPTNSLKAAPLVRIRLDNFIMSGASTDGLVVAMAGVSYNPTLDDGMFAEEGVGPNTYKWYPKSFEVSLRADVMHDHPVGWNSNNQWRGGGSFPHGVQGAPMPSTLSPSAASAQNAAANTVLNTPTNTVPATPRGF